MIHERGMERAYEFADDALVDEDGDGEAEEADDGEAAARPAEVELEVLPAGVPLLDPLVLVNLHPATHLLLLLPFSPRIARLVGDGWMRRRRIWLCECRSVRPCKALPSHYSVFQNRPPNVPLFFQLSITWSTSTNLGIV